MDENNEVNKETNKEFNTEANKEINSEVKVEPKVELRKEVYKEVIKEVYKDDKFQSNFDKEFKSSTGNNQSTKKVNFVGLFFMLLIPGIIIIFIVAYSFFVIFSSSETNTNDEVERIEQVEQVEQEYSGKNDGRKELEEEIGLTPEQSAAAAEIFHKCGISKFGNPDTYMKEDLYTHYQIDSESPFLQGLSTYWLDGELVRIEYGNNIMYQSGIVYYDVSEFIVTPAELENYEVLVMNKLKQEDPNLEYEYTDTYGGMHTYVENPDEDIVMVWGTVNEISEYGTKEMVYNLIFKGNKIETFQYVTLN